MAFLDKANFEQGSGIASSTASTRDDVDLVYNLSSGVNLRFLRDDVEKEYVGDLTKEATRDTRKLTSGVTLTVLLVIFMRSIAIVLIYQSESTSYPSQTRFDLLATSWPGIALGGYVLVLWIAARLISTSYAEFLLLWLQLSVQTYIICSNKFRLLYLRILSQDDIVTYEEWSEVPDSLRILSRDYVHFVLLYVFMGTFFSFSRVRSKFSWLAPALSSTMCLINFFALTPPCETEPGQAE
jgi:hypothetical protein